VCGAAGCEGGGSEEMAGAAEMKNLLIGFVVGACALALLTHVRLAIWPDKCISSRGLKPVRWIVLTPEEATRYQVPITQDNWPK